MKYGDLLTYLDAHADYTILDGSPAETLEKALTDKHQDALAGEIIKSSATHADITSVEQEIERVDFVKSLSAVRLKYMADDAPVEGFRMVEKIITTADAAYNEEALAARGS
ncbi:MAG: hypothetical protein P8Y64_11770 [Gammaproteobacteria bacterium]|jgi:hypothetical protein